MNRDNNFPFKDFIKINEKNIIFYKTFKYKFDVNESSGIQIDFTIYKNFKQLRSWFLSLSYNRGKFAMFTLFYLSDKPLIKYLIKRILYSMISAKKILFMKILFSIGVIKRTNINRFLDSIPDRSQNYVFVTLYNFSYIAKVIELFMNVELEYRTSLNIFIFTLSFILN